MTWRCLCVLYLVRAVGEVHADDINANLEELVKGVHSLRLGPNGRNNVCCAVCGWRIVDAKLHAQFEPSARVLELLEVRAEK